MLLRFWVAQPLISFSVSGPRCQTFGHSDLEWNLDDGVADPFPDSKAVEITAKMSHHNGKEPTTEHGRPLLNHIAHLSLLKKTD